jgi:xanthine dehydrogenase accessory factor
MRDVLVAMLEAEGRGERVALVTVVATAGSAPQRPGAKMLVYRDDRLVGTIGGGCFESEIARQARQAIASGKCQLVSFDLTPDQAGEDGLICGGRMQVFIEPVVPTPTLCLFGAGHVAQPLAGMAKAVGFRVEVADDRVKFANEERFPRADRIVVDDWEPAAAKMTWGPDTYVVIATRGHKGDQDVLAAALGRERRYLGLVGSRAKALQLARALESRGVAREALAGVSTPVGLEIGAVSPAEIAVSILAEMIAIRRGADPAQVRPKRVELRRLLGE